MNSPSWLLPHAGWFMKYEAAAAVVVEGEVGAGCSWWLSYVVMGDLKTFISGLVAMGRSRKRERLD